MELMPHQEKAVERLGNGKILYGVVGSGKSITALAYYVKKEAPKHVYVITTAKKRDSLDWEGEAAKYGIGDMEDATVYGILSVDSWQNIGKYKDVKDAFFIFDEQRLVGYGAWVKNFFKIAANNHWILLSATPGDNWMDYAPIFIANGFYKNLTAFKLKHVLYEPFVRYPRIRGYLGETKLELLRNEILVEMPYPKNTRRWLNYLDCGFDKSLLDTVLKRRWHVYEDRPLKDVAEMWRVMRRVVNSDPSRLDMIRNLLLRCHNRLIIFYNFNYELEILRGLDGEIEVAEWNGHRKQPIPETDKWVYLVQYVAGAEGWNCVKTDAMVLYSLTYSYKNTEQAMGRIDRLNTLYTDLFIYSLISSAICDKAVKGSLDRKEDFNVVKWIKENGTEFGADPNVNEMGQSVLVNR